MEKIKMSKVFLSFLGISNYTICNYTYNDKIVKNVRFVQEALIRIFCRDFNKNDRIIIFLTDDAKNNNWERHKNNKGLGEILNDMLMVNIQKPLIKTVRIPIGNSENDIWEIFGIMYENINENDEIILDITHSFRSIPMLAMVFLNYAKFLKRINVRGIYYGAFEARDKNNNSPIFNLTSFDKLQQWSIAADNFVNYGITDKISRILEKEADNVLQENNTNESARHARDFASTLKKISADFNTVRGQNIINGKSFIYQKNNIDKIGNENLISEPLKILKNKILKEIKPFRLNDINNGFRAVEWYIKHKLIQQGITMLQETIITAILNSVGEDLEDVSNRMVASDCTKVINKKIPEDKWSYRLKSNIELTRKLLKNGTFVNLSQSYENLRDERNDINHGGYVVNSRSSERLRNKLQETYSKVKEIIFRDNI